MREIVGIETRELTTYKAKLEERARQEEELFIRAPLTKMEKKKEKHLKKSRNGYVFHVMILVVVVHVADSICSDIRLL